MDVILGYVVSERRLRGLRWFVRQVTSVSDVMPGVPYIVVGYSEAKSQEGFRSVLDKSLGDGRFWTFRPTEKRSAYEDDMNAFYSYIINIAVSEVRYVYASPFRLSFGKLRKMLRILQTGHSNCIYLSDGMLYAYYGEGYVIGMSFDDLEYAGIGHDRVIKLIKMNDKNVIIDDTDKTVSSLLGVLGTRKYAVPSIVKTKSRHG